MKTYKTKNYKANISFFFPATDENEAIGIADSIADLIEKSEDWKFEAKVGEVETLPCAVCDNGTRSCYEHGKVAD